MNKLIKYILIDFVSDVTQMFDFHFAYKDGFFMTLQLLGHGNYSLPYLFKHFCSLTLSCCLMANDKVESLRLFKMLLKKVVCPIIAWLLYILHQDNKVTAR